MATVLFDAESHGVDVSNTVLTVAHTCASIANRLLLVWVARWWNQTTLSLTYAGVPMTLVGSQGSGGDAKNELYQLVAPTAGVNNIVLTVNTTNPMGLAACSFTGVDQTTPLGTVAGANGNSTSPSIAVTAGSADDLVADGVIISNITTATVGTGQTQRTNIQSGTTEQLCGSTEPGVAGTVTMDWSLTVARFWSSLGVAVKPTTAPPSDTFGATWAVQSPQLVITPGPMIASGSGPQPRIV